MSVALAAGLLCDLLRCCFRRFLVAEVVAALWNQVAIELVHEWDPCRNVETGDVLLRHVVEMHHERTQAVAVGGYQHATTRPYVRHHGVVPVREHSSHNVGEALGGGDHIRRQRGKPRVVLRVVLVFAVEGEAAAHRTSVATASPARVRAFRLSAFCSDPGGHRNGAR